MDACSDPMKGQHTDPVWGVEWVQNQGAADGRQRFCSISADGHVRVWILDRWTLATEEVHWCVLRRLFTKFTS